MVEIPAGSIRWIIRRDTDDVILIDRLSFPFSEHWNEKQIIAHLKHRNWIGTVHEEMIGNSLDVTGYAIYSLHTQFIRIQRMAVHPEHRCRGVGLAMIERIKDKIRKNDRRRYVRVSCPLETAEYFASHGFIAHGMVDDDVEMSWSEEEE